MKTKALRNFSTVFLALTLAACGGGGSSSSSGGIGSGSGSGGGGGTGGGGTTQKFYTNFEDVNEASRFMIQAGLGTDYSGLETLVDMDAARWLELEFSRPRTDFLSPIRDEYLSNGDIDFHAASFNYWTQLFDADDVLRMRMGFALSQIFVISDYQVNYTPLSSSYYQDILSRNAFGNYRDLLEDITYSPAMADFLTYLFNRKGDPDSGRMPDENYAREILQLFTIGLVELNMDGTPKLSGGEPIETYTNDDIRGLAKVFTGLGTDADWFWDYSPEGFMQPLKMFDEYHSEEAKTFLGSTIAEGTSGRDSIDQALDIIFEHPNVPPFVSRQLIQRFTASNPSPEYVERVATAFADGTYRAPDGTSFGTGRRGDLRATVAAILLDESMHEVATNGDGTNGKIREPVLKLVHWARAFSVQDPFAVEDWRFYDTSNPATALGQHPIRPPSVFNFYRPGYVAPGTQAGEAGMTTPEFQIVNEGSVLGYINFMTDFVYDRTGGSEEVQRFTPDYSGAMEFGDDPTALVDHLDQLMTGGQMSDAEKTAVVNVVSAMEVAGDNNRERFERVRIGVLLIASTPSYAIIE